MQNNFVRVHVVGGAGVPMSSLPLMEVIEVEKKKRKKKEEDNQYQ